MYVCISTSILFLVVSPIAMILIAPFTGLGNALYAILLFDGLLMILIIILVIILSLYVYFTGYEKDRFNKK